MKTVAQGFSFGPVERHLSPFDSVQGNDQSRTIASVTDISGLCRPRSSIAPSWGRRRSSPTLAAALIREGVLDEKATVSRDVPELKSSGFVDATLRPCSI